MYVSNEELITYLRSPLLTDSLQLSPLTCVDTTEYVWTSIRIVESKIGEREIRASSLVRSTLSSTLPTEKVLCHSIDIQIVQLLYLGTSKNGIEEHGRKSKNSRDTECDPSRRIPSLHT